MESIAAQSSLACGSIHRPSGRRLAEGPCALVNGGNAKPRSRRVRGPTGSDENQGAAFWFPPNEPTMRGPSSTPCSCSADRAERSHPSLPQVPPRRVPRRTGIRTDRPRPEPDAPVPRILLIGQAPGLQATRYDRPFAGAAGEKLRDWLRKAGIPRDDFYRRKSTSPPSPAATLADCPAPRETAYHPARNKPSAAPGLMN